MTRIAAGLAALVLVAVMAGCKGKEKSNVAADIVGTWGCVVPYEVPGGYEHANGEIYYKYTEDIIYEFETDGSYSYSSATGLSPAILRDGTYIVNAKQGKIVLTDSWGNDPGPLEIKGDTLVDAEGNVFTK